MSKIKRNGFTLVELMISLSIIAILTVIALPAFHAYTIRTRIIEGLQLSTSARMVVGSEAAASFFDLKTSAATWNAQANNTGANSKYVNSILIDENTGVITITYNPSTVGLAANENTLTLTPWVRNGPNGQALAAAIAAGHANIVDWGCASASDNTASSQGITVTQRGTLKTKYVPSQCQ